MQALRALCTRCTLATVLLLACTAYGEDAKNVLAFDRMPNRTVADWEGHITLRDGGLVVNASDKGAALFNLDPPIDLSKRLDQPLYLVAKRGEKWTDTSGAFTNIFLIDADGTQKHLRVNNWDLPHSGLKPAATATQQTLADGKIIAGESDGVFDASRIVRIDLKGNWSDRDYSVFWVALKTQPRRNTQADPSKDPVITGSPPHIQHLGMVSPQMLGVTIDAQRRVAGQQTPYTAQPGDTVDDHPMKTRWVRREGQIIGSLIGREDQTLMPFDTLEGAPLKTGWTGRPSSYRLVNPDGSDPRYAAPVEPLAVHRKSKPTDEARLGSWAFGYPMRHTLYLELPEALQPGASYELRLIDHQPALQPQAFVFDPTQLRSEAVRVSHIGFRPSDLVKVGYLSLWMGDGGPLDYPEGLPFHVIDASGNVAYTGTTELSLAKDQTEAGRGRNYSSTDVHRLDFSPINQPGTYRLVVEGIGCSHAFEIKDDVWVEPFRISMMGLLHHRSGIELGPPFTDYRRPATMVPGQDGFMVYAAQTTVLNRDGSKVNQNQIFHKLMETGTQTPVPQAVGGYMDAGDWDRRVEHLVATRMLLELFEFHPDYFTELTLNLPEAETRNTLPDLLDEAVFNLDFYRRLQTAEGGVRGWVESVSHPRFGEASWQESLAVYATEPEPWASYLFAATAARFARVSDAIDAELAETYRSAALRAFDWSEAELSGWDAETLHLRDARNLAAVELYRLTGAPRFHDVFLDTTAFDQPRPGPQQWQQYHQREAAYAYAAIDNHPVDTTVQQHARNALLAEANQRAEMSTQTGFGWTNDPLAWVGWGQQSALVHSLSLVRAHALTGEPRYLAAIQRAVQFGVGANPLNLSLTTGIGHDWPRNPLHVDALVTNQPAPAGITIYGPDDPAPRGPDAKPYWANLKIIRGHAIHPPIQTWPALESHWDFHAHPASSEYTIMQTLGPAAYFRGYLAAISPPPQSGNR
ncbi:MAG: glycoside hydrolase family 9 protein [Planctomycetota bacterium]